MADKEKITLMACGSGSKPKSPETKETAGKIRSLQVDFPLGVRLPPGFEQTLASLVNMVCELYEQQNPYRSMWPFGQGGKPDQFAIHSDDFENMFDMSVYQIEVSEKPASETVLRQRGYTLCDTSCHECGETQFHPKMEEMLEPGYVTCANRHMRESGADQGIPIQRVHVLSAGFPLCMFTQDVPAKWPTHHQWVSFESPNASLTANCRPCLKVLRNMKFGQ